MARASVKENKNIYQVKREELGLSREKAGELLQYITPERLERIESGKSNAHPDEVILMAEMGDLREGFVGEEGQVVFYV